MSCIHAAQAGDTPLSAAEIRLRFFRLVAYCRELKAHKRLHSGIEILVNDRMQIGVRAIPPEVPAGKSPPDLTELLRTGLTAFQRLRFIIAKYFNLDSKSWNDSHIGKMLNLIEQQLREQTCTVEALGHKLDTLPYNALDIVFYSGEAASLSLWLLSPEFQKLWRWQRLSAANAKAVEFFDRVRRHSQLQQASIMAQFALALDELLHVRDDPAIAAVVATMVTQDIGTYLRHYFGPAAR